MPCSDSHPDLILLINGRTYNIPASKYIGQVRYLKYCFNNFKFDYLQNVLLMALQSSRHFLFSASKIYLTYFNREKTLKRKTMMPSIFRDQIRHVMYK